MARKQRTQPTTEQLERMMRDHLSFEIGRFQETASLWGKHEYGEPADAMIRESCLIHMRLLLDFFYPRTDPQKSQYEDIFCSDYLPDQAALSEELRDLLREPSWLQEYRDQLDWRLAHLTLKRIEFEKRPVWKPLGQLAHIERLITLFIGAVPPKMKTQFNARRL